MLVRSGLNYIAFQQLVHVFAGLSDHGHWCQDRYRLVRLQHDPQNGSAAGGFHGDYGFVSLYVEKRFAVLNGISDLLMPLGNGALVLGVAQLGHDNNFSHDVFLL